MTAEFGASFGLAGGTRAASLRDAFVIPPFSVLDTRQGYWQERRRAWLALGIQSELGRGNIPPGGGGGGGWLHGGQEGREAADPKYRAQRLASADGGLTGQMAAGRGTARFRGAMDVSAAAALSGGWDQHPSRTPGGPARTVAQDLMRKEHIVGERREADQHSNVTGAPQKPEWATGTGTGTENMAPGTSIFDPVLAEVLLRWFAPAGGLVLDPFAGGSVRGIVAGYLGHPYVGIDLSARQLEANRAQLGILPEGSPVPEWRHGDSLGLLPDAPRADMLLTCPPYFDLEVYGNDPGELSAMTWGQFCAAYGTIVLRACERLQPGRFAAWVVSEVRGSDGNYRGLVPLTIRAFLEAGMNFYNEIVLVNSVGSLPIRITRQFMAGRKVGRTHQNVLVFVKGQPERGMSIDRTAPRDPQIALWGDLSATT